MAAMEGTGSPEEQTRGLIVDLSHRHQHISKAIEWFEEQYLKNPNKNQTEILTKDYIADALKKVAEDVDVISTNLDEYLSRQTDTVEEISYSLNHANMRLKMLKEQHGAARLASMRQDKPQPVREMKVTEPDPDPAPVFERISIEKRFEKIAAIGVSLKD